MSVVNLFKEEAGGSQPAKVRVSPNRRVIKLQKAFEKLKPVEKQVVLKRVEGLARQCKPLTSQRKEWGIGFQGQTTEVQEQDHSARGLSGATEFV